MKRYHAARKTGGNERRGPVRSRRPVQRFSLTELLVVSVVIAVLLALSLTALNIAREYGYMSLCINNFKQMSCSLGIYLSDSSDMFPAWNDGGVLNKNNWYGYYLATMHNYVPKGKVYDATMNVREYLPGQDPLGSGDAEWGKAVPVGWVCPMRVISFNSLGKEAGADAYELRFHRYGLIKMAVNKDDIRNSPKSCPVAAPVGRMPSPASYSYMAESGWEPLQRLAFAQHASTPFLFANEKKYGYLDGFRQFGHRNGFTVAFIDGHVRFLSRKRVHQTEGEPLESQLYVSRVVDSRDL